jgi:hypothetical protein
VFSMGEELLLPFGTSFHELIERRVISLNDFVKIIYCSHIEISYMVGTSSLSKATPHV